MPVATYGEEARAAAGLAVIDRIPGKHTCFAPDVKS
jgi:hypothetical protein